MIDKNSPIPAYFQLKEMIKEQILSGIYIVGDCISSERELSEKYKVSRMTVRQALGELVSEGYLIKEKGKGTFVSEPKIKQEDLMSFTEIIAKSNRNLETKVLELKEITTPNKLKVLFTHETLYKINRVRIVDGEPIANEIIYIPKEYTGELNIDTLKNSFYKVLEKNNILIDRVESSVKAVVLTDNHKKIFMLSNEQVPLLQTNNKSITADDVVIFFEEATYRSDKYILEVNISKREGKIK